MNGYTQINFKKSRTVVSQTCQSKWKPFHDDLQTSCHTFDASGVSWFEEIGDLSLIKFCKMKNWP